MFELKFVGTGHVLTKHQETALSFFNFGIVLLSYLWHTKQHSTQCTHFMEEDMNWGSELFILTSTNSNWESRLLKTCCEYLDWHSKSRLVSFCNSIAKCLEAYDMDVWTILVEVEKHTCVTSHTYIECRTASTDDIPKKFVQSTTVTDVTTAQTYKLRHSH